MSLTRRIVPLLDRVLVKRVLPTTQLASGLYVPDSKVGKGTTGEVLAAGPGGRSMTGELIPMPLAVGDKVLLPDFGGQLVKLDSSSDEEGVYLFRADEILAKVED